MKQDNADAYLKFDKTFICKLSDSTVYTLQVAVKDEKTFVKCTAEFADKKQRGMDRFLTGNSWQLQYVVSIRVGQ